MSVPMQKTLLSRFFMYPFKGCFFSSLVKLGDLEGQIQEQDTLAIQKLFLQTCDLDRLAA